MRAPVAEILAATEGRQWPVPKRPWVMWQIWSDLLFAHWPIPADVMAAHLPSGITLDTWEGEAWLGIVPFHMPTVHIHGVPDLPYLSRLVELNVRTYVTVDGLPGVFFFSLDADNPIEVQVARSWFHLPYFHARFDCDFITPDRSVRYRMRRTDRRARPAIFDATYRPVGPAQRAAPGSLADWLTARYALYTTDRRGRVHRGDITHAPWPLAPAEAEIRANTLAASHGFTLPDIPPLLHFSRRIDTLAWTTHQV
jgi:uncharacterized protein YqjF (DUF2071 family)